MNHFKMNQKSPTTYDVEIDGIPLYARKVNLSVGVDEIPYVQLELISQSDVECNAIVELDDDFVIEQCAIKLRNIDSNFTGRLAALVNRINEEDVQKIWGKENDSESAISDASEGET